MVPRSIKPDMVRMKRQSSFSYLMARSIPNPTSRSMKAEATSEILGPSSSPTAGTNTIAGPKPVKPFRKKAVIQMAHISRSVSIGYPRISR